MELEILDGELEFNQGVASIPREWGLYYHLMEIQELPRDKFMLREDKVYVLSEYGEYMGLKTVKCKYTSYPLGEMIKCLKYQLSQNDIGVLYESIKYAGIDLFFPKHRSVEEAIQHEMWLTKAIMYAECQFEKRKEEPSFSRIPQLKLDADDKMRKLGMQLNKYLTPQ